MGLKVPLLGALLWVGAAGQAPSPTAFLFTQTPRFDGACPNRFPLGGAVQIVSTGRVAPLVPSFAASADPAVSFDGRRILFSGKQRPADAWQIWELPAIGGAPRRVTQFPDDAIAPFYAAGERIVYARHTPAGFQLEASLADGHDAIRLTYAPGDYVPTGVLRDGRILFEGPHPGSAGRDLFTVYLDGSGVETYRCDHRHDRSAAFETASGDIFFNVAGRLAHFTSPRAVEMDLPPVPGEFGGRAAEATSGELLAGYRPAAGQPFAIFRWRPGQGAPQKVVAAAQGDAVQPVLLRPHDVPKRHPSALGNREGANLLCLNVYTSKSRIVRGSVASVRLWTLADTGAALPSGEAPVEIDGSFFVQVPADRAIRFELLDRARKTIASEKGWFWARQGEQRVCVGCHAGPERAPDNALPRVLVHGADPVRLLPSARAAKGSSK
jgi:hypothetical protein